MHLWNVGWHWFDYMAAVYLRRLNFILTAVRTWSLTHKKRWFNLNFLCVMSVKQVW
jgi:hypothetical protein